MAEEIYAVPAITDLGSFAERTLDHITKSPGNSDVISVTGQTGQPAPGGGVISIS